MNVDQIIEAADLANGAGDLSDVRAAWLDVLAARIANLDAATRSRRGSQRWLDARDLASKLAAKSDECRRAFEARGGKNPPRTVDN